MILWGVITWWYTDGWGQRWTQVQRQFETTLDFFSIGLLMKTLFAPFRQISAGSVKGSLDVQIRAFFDRLVSRCIGMAVRLVMIGVGALVITFNLFVGGVLLLIWALVPLLPLIGLALCIIGWLPWN